MARVPLSKLNATTLKAAIRESIKEAREKEMPVRNLRWVTEISTGRRGWIVQEMNHGFHWRVRWEGEKGALAVTRVRVEEIDFDE